MNEKEIESRILICEIKEREYREIGNTKSADRYLNERHKWEILLSRLDLKRDKELVKYQKGYNRLQSKLDRLKAYIQNNQPVIRLLTKTQLEEIYNEQYKNIMEIIGEENE